MEAAKTGSESAVYLLLAAEADVTMEDGVRWSPPPLPPVMPLRGVGHWHGGRAVVAAHT